MRDGRTTQAWVHKPSTPTTTPLPLLIYIHGGGFCLGHPSHVALSAASLARALPAIVVAPTYRLAPAHPFPAAPDDVWDAFRWLATPANAAALGADISTDGLLVGGISAGANLAAVTAQRYLSERDERAPRLAGVVLVVPSVLEAGLVPAAQRELWFSREQNAGALIINAKALEYVRRSYAPDVRSAQYSPFNAETPHVGMPPVYVQVCGQDPLRDDGLVYERVLRGEGVRTRLDAYAGVPHGHMFVFPQLEASLRANLDLIGGVAWLLGKEVEREVAEKALGEAGEMVKKFFAV